jgi:hypothetical protein
VQVHLGLDVAIGDLEACFEAAAHEAAPGHFRPQLLLQRAGAGAAGGQYLGQLRAVDVHVGGDVVEGIVHVGLGGVDRVALGFAYFQELVDQDVDHLLTRRCSMGAHLDEFRALLDVERRDRLTIDEQHDLLRMGRGAAHGNEGERAQ